MGSSPHRLHSGLALLEQGATLELAPGVVEQASPGAGPLEVKVQVMLIVRTKELCICGHLAENHGWLRLFTTTTTGTAAGSVLVRPGGDPPGCYSPGCQCQGWEPGESD